MVVTTIRGVVVSLRVCVDQQISVEWKEDVVFGAESTSTTIGSSGRNLNVSLLKTKLEIYADFFRNDKLERQQYSPEKLELKENNLN